jgi:hypothetical protein
VRKGKRRGKKEVSETEQIIAQPGTRSIDQQSPNWGLFEPIRQILDPISSILGPLITSQVIIIVLGLLLAYTWLWSPRHSSNISHYGSTSPERLAAYEEIWRKEESALWDWLEDRVGLNDMYAPPSDRAERQKVLNARGMGRKLEGDDRMTERQVNEAIRTTEEKLAALKDAVRRKNQGKKTG